MTAAGPATEVRVARMSISSMCRDDRHRSCADLKMRCACHCHGQKTAKPETSKTESPPVKDTPPRAKFPPVTGGQIGTPPAPPKPAPTSPLVELVKADPPEKPRKLNLVEQVRPLLEEILVGGDRDWFRVVLFFKANQANFNIRRLADAHSKTEWEWRAVKLSEAGQSAIYVRWVGKTGVVV